MNFLSVLYAKAGITVDGVTELNNTATALTPATNDNSTKIATTAFVKNQNYYPYPTGTTAQYVRGDGSLATFSQGGGGGGSSVNYYLNGSVSQGTIGGNTYYEMSKNAIIGTNADFSINADGYVAQFVTDAGDPALLNIPGGNWNFEMFFSASSGGGTPSFYVELYKYDGTTLTLIASGSTAPESITGGTATDLYITALAVPLTTLTLTDRLAVRVYVNNSGRTITLHTQNGHLCQAITTFSTGLTALNGLTAQVQNFAVGTGGTDFNISSVTDTHTFNLPTASATKRGALSSIDWSAFDAKVDFGDLSATSPLSYNGSGVFSIAQSSTSTNGYLSSTDWNTFNNKQNALTNPVTGTGTAGYITKWVSGSAVGNSALQEASSYIQSSKRIEADDAGYGLVAFSSAGNRQVVLGVYLGEPAIQGTLLNGTARQLSINSNGGNVLIGTSGDNGQKFQLLGDAAIYKNAEFLQSIAVNSGESQYQTWRNSVGTRRGYFGFPTGSSNDLVLHNETGGIIGLYGGNVLIGTTTDAGYKLDVNGTARVNSALTIYSTGLGLILKSQDNTGSYIRFSHNSAGDYAYIGDAYHLLVSPYSLTTDLAIRAEGALVLTSGGVTPRLTLATSGAATFSSSVTATRGIFQGSTGETLTAQGIAGEWTTHITGAASTGNSYGLVINAGTNASDLALGIYNQAFNSTLFTIKGDGAATFSSSVTAGGNLTIGLGASQANIYLNRSANTSIENAIRWQTNGTNDWYLGSAASGANSDLEFYNYGIGAVNFKLSRSTGAATFSSSVTAGSLIKSGGTSSQYLMADGSTSTLTNPVTGTGTTNYITKWVSGSAVGNSIIYDNGTNVGIGTTNPGANLVVGTQSSGDSSGDNSAITRLGASSAAGRIYGLTIANTATSTVGNDASLSFIVAGNYSATAVVSAILKDTSNAYTDMAFSVYGGSGNVERMRILGVSGNVGIGTTNPGYKLDVIGDSYTSGNIRIGGSNVFYFDTFNGGWYMQDTVWIRSYASKSLWMDSGKLGADGGLTIGYGGASPSSGGAIIAGSVGIGTSSPVSQFEVYTNTYKRFWITYPSTYATQLNFGTWAYMSYNAGDASLNLFASDTTYGNLRLGTGSSEAMRILINGNVLIGTTTDNGAKLQVNGSPYFGSDAFTFNNGGIFFSGYGSYARGVYSNSNGLTLQTSGSPKVTINDSGYVGVGTQTPNYRLESTSTALFGTTAYGVLNIAGDNPSYIKIKTNIPFSYGSQGYTVNIKGFQYGSAQTLDLQVCWHQYADAFYSPTITSKGSFAPVVRLARESGLVVIVLTWGQYWPKLYVESVHNYANDGYANGWTWADENVTGDKTVTLSYKNDFGDGFVKTAAGFVGIGTNSPSYKLHVVASTGAGDYVAYIQNTGAGNGLKIYNADWDLTDYLLYASNGGGYVVSIDGNGKVNATSFTANNRTILTSGGLYDNSTNGNNIGIGFGASVLISTDGAGTYSAQNLGNSTYPWYSATFVSSVTATNFIGAGTGLTGTASALSIGGSAGTAEYTTGTAGGAIRTWDIRTISPSSMTANRMGFGFTSFNNNNTSPWADYIHLRSYGDSSGGADNLIVFNKSTIGMRIYQQTFGSSTAYSSYKDIAFTDGTNASGTWGISITGNANYATTAGALTSMNISQFTNDAGYITSTSSTFSYTASVTLSPTWQNTGVSSANLTGSGVYIVTCNANDFGVSGGQYNCTYTGIMYWFAGGTNGSNVNEIVLHHTGHADNNRYIYLRTLSTVTADGKTYLQISGNGTNSGASNYQLTFKKIL